MAKGGETCSHVTIWQLWSIFGTNHLFFCTFLFSTQVWESRRDCNHSTDKGKTQHSFLCVCIGQKAAVISEVLRIYIMLVDSFPPGWYFNICQLHLDITWIQGNFPTVSGATDASWVSGEMSFRVKQQTCPITWMTVRGYANASISLWL